MMRGEQLPTATIPPSVDSTNTGPTAHASAEQSAAIVAAVITTAVIATAPVVGRGWGVICRSWIISNGWSVVGSGRGIVRSGWSVVGSGWSIVRSDWSVIRSGRNVVGRRRHVVRSRRNRRVIRRRWQTFTLSISCLCESKNRRRRYDQCNCGLHESSLLQKSRLRLVRKAGVEATNPYSTSSNNTSLTGISHLRGAWNRYKPKSPPILTSIAALKPRSGGR